MWEYNQSTQLYHYGVLGMRWGKRKTQPSSVKSSILAGAYAATRSKKIGEKLDKSNDKDAKKWEKAKNKESIKADNKWTEEATSFKTTISIYNNAADKINSQIDSFNKKWDKVNFNDPKLAKYNEQYVTAYGNKWNKMLQESASEIVKVNPSGTKKISVRAHEVGGLPSIYIQDV